MTQPSPAAGVILLNGASSSGKSTLARKIQDAAPVPMLHLSSDQLADGGAIPGRRDSAGPFGWPGQMRTRFFDGFHRSIAAMLHADNDLVVDHVVEYRSWLVDLAKLLTGHQVLFVGVLCDVSELRRREVARGDRRPGEAQAHLDSLNIHSFSQYDITVDTTRGVLDHQVADILGAWRDHSSPSRLFDACS